VSRSRASSRPRSFFSGWENGHRTEPEESNGKEAAGNPKGVVPVSVVHRGHNPVGVGWVRATISQGSSFLATLGSEPKSLWDFSLCLSILDVRLGACLNIRLNASFASSGLLLLRGENGHRTEHEHEHEHEESGF
jgi:hypothetical protein